MKTSTSVLTVLILATFIVGAVYYFRDTTGPRIEITPPGGSISKERPLRLELSDEGSGLRNVTATVVQGERISTLFAEDYADFPGTRSESFNLEEAQLEEGPFEVRIEAIDQAIFNFGAGNVTEENFQFDYDSRAPTVSVLSRAHNLTQGGVGLVVYTVSEELERTGVTVDDLFFPGYELEPGRYACFFVMPHDMAPAEFVPRLIAVDRAGNERLSGFYYHANPRNFPQGRINVTQRFLDVKMPEFQDRFPRADTLLDVFLQVNRDLRQQNRRTLQDIAGQTAPRPLWDGPFLRQPNSATMGQFADRRSYFFDGRRIDQQTHLGVDLASVSQAPILAAQDGIVVFAEYLGIYGECIIIDHGLGLQSLYGHLSSIGVNEGDKVSKGQVIGHSGASGLAGGDHLHFAMLVSGIPVSPVEWWDPAWLENNVTGKLQQLSDQALAR